MPNKEQDYAKAAFEDVASKYDEIKFFKISAYYVVDTIKRYKEYSDLDILDVACGTGNVVLECASCLKGSTFDAIDLSQSMLQKARENAQKENLTNITFHTQDITKMTLKKNYDVITCSYALFFLPDAFKVLQTLKGMLKDEGIVIFTSFTKEAFSPTTQILLPLLRDHGSQTAIEYELDKWENLKEPKDIKHLCSLADVDIISLDTKHIRYNLSLDQWWELLNNTGYKGMLIEIAKKDLQIVKENYYKQMLEYADMDGDVELIADSFFVVIR